MSTFILWFLRLLFLGLLGVNALFLNVVGFTVDRVLEGRVEEGGIVPVTVYPPEELQLVYFLFQLLVFSNTATILMIVVALLMVAPEKISEYLKYLSTSRHKVGEG